jgi:CheY-like chemotaxis protein
MGAQFSQHAAGVPDRGTVSRGGFYLETISPKAKILFIEDEMNMRYFLKTLLETNGFFPIMARNGREGLQLARKEHPELILLDVMMPEQGGALTYVKIREEDDLRDIPVMILSGIAKQTFFHYLDMVNAVKTKTIPFPEAYIQKPPEPDHLLHWIQKIVNKKNHETE